MLTRDECEKALDRVADFCSWFNPYKCPERIKFKNELDILDKLIEEHFDNPPLKFEELKEGMWIWDNKDKAYMKIESVCDKDWVWLYIDSSEREHIDELYEPNRFYRKEVRE